MIITQLYQLPFIYKEHEEIDQSSINELTKSALALDNKIEVNIDGSLSIKHFYQRLENLGCDFISM